MKTGHTETGNCQELLEKYPAPADRSSANLAAGILKKWNATRPELVVCLGGCCNCDLCVKAKGKKNICNRCAVRLKEAEKK